MDDVLRALGHLCLGSRLKRIGEQLQADTQRLLDQLDASVQAGQHPMLAALDRLGPLTIGDLAQALGVSQPGVTRSVARLIELGLVEAASAPGDQRQRIISLSAQGRTLVDTAKRDLWPRIDAAVAELCAAHQGPLLEQLAGIEDGLAAEPLDQRAGRQGGQAR